MTDPYAAGRAVAARVTAPLQHFMKRASAAGIVLLTCAAIAMAWANSPWAQSYHALWETPISALLGARGARFTFHQAINDGLMAVFFFLVGLEIKREVLVGELASRRRAALPVSAALGGMVVPALLFAAVNAGGNGSAGWGIPMATDIAFALGVLALLGDRVPSSLRVFLSALAIADDLGAVVVIALFYSGGVAWSALLAAAALLAVSALANAAGVRALWPYALIGIALWLAVLSSGVHATVAGVLLAMTIPSRTEQAEAPLARFEHGLQGVVNFGIMPLFALANAGVSLHGAEALIDAPVAIGVLLGLVIGKPLGITLAAWLAVKSGLAVRPADAGWRLIHGVAWLGGVGFTMSLFIAGLAFADAAPLLTSAKLGTLLASLIAGVVGWVLLRTAVRAR